MIGLPQKGLIFLCGIRLLPLRAGISAIIFGALGLKAAVL